MERVVAVALLLLSALPVPARAQRCWNPLEVYSGYAGFPVADPHQLRCDPYGQGDFGIDEDTRLILPHADTLYLAYFSSPGQELFDVITVVLDGLGFEEHPILLYGDGHPEAPNYFVEGSFPLDSSASGCLHLHTLEFDEHADYHTYDGVCPDDPNA